MILTLVVFGVAVLLWVCTPLDDTFVALAAVAALLLFGVLPASSLAALGGATTWLLLAAFVLAAGVTASGLTTRLATWLVGRARTVRGLAHLVSLGLLLSAFFVPSTSGRAALALPVFGALASALKDRRRVVRALGVLFPSVILLTAVATLVGAGAHLITNALLETATGHGIGFGWWLLLGVPLAVVSAHVTAEIVLWLFTTREDRARPLHVEVGEGQAACGATAGGGGAADRAACGATAEGGGAPDQATVELPVPVLAGVSAARGGAARSEGPLQGVPCSNSPAQHRQFRTLEFVPRPTTPLEILDPVRANNTPVRANNTPVRANSMPAHANNTPVRIDGMSVHAESTPVRADNMLARANNTPVRINGMPARVDSTPARADRTPARADRTQATTSWRHRAATLTRPEWTALTVVLAVSIAWLTEPWHHIPPEVSALTGALLITAPKIGTTTFKSAFAEVPWSLLVFMAATTALGTALIKSGAADLAARHLGGSSNLQLLAAVIGVSLAAHLVVQSRSARSSVLIPIVIPLALAAGMNPAALAFASTAAAGFCHTLTSSAKPVALFADAYRPKDLLKLSAVLAPVTGLLVFAAAVLLWPHLGLPLK